MKFEVNRRICNSPEEALTLASRLIYISPASIEGHKHKLKEGQRIAIVYGFSQIEIRPIADTSRASGEKEVV